MGGSSGRGNGLLSVQGGEGEGGQLQVSGAEEVTERQGVEDIRLVVPPDRVNTIRSLLFIYSLLLTS